MRSTTLFFYAGNQRAASASVDDAMIRSEQYKGGVAGSSTLDKTVNTVNTLQSMTYFKGEAGEEKQDFTQSYHSNGIGVRSTTIFYYEKAGGGDQRAQTAGADDAMVRSEQYRLGTAGSSVLDKTLNTLQSMTYFKGTAGEEKQDFSQSYRSDGTVKSTSPPQAGRQSRHPFRARGHGW